MNDAQKILKMIEGVDKEDTATLGEIDARVWCLENGHTFDHMTEAHSLSIFRYVNGYTERGNLFRAVPPQYARSRDLLKSIRPEGWSFYGGYVGKYAEYAGNKAFEHVESFADAPTEELAELHAIIQAIEWGRENDSTISKT